jgi:diguanylate cyclase (GGDEF)-like protein
VRFQLPQAITRLYHASKSSSGTLLLIAGVGLATLGLVVLSGIWAGAESDLAALERQRNLITQRLSEQVDQVAKAIGQVGSGTMSLLSEEIGMGTAAAGEGTASALGPADMDAAAAVAEMVVAVFGYDRAFVTDGTGQLAMRSNAETEKRYRWMKPLLLPLLQGLAASSERQTASPGDTAIAERGAAQPRLGALAELMRVEGRPTIAGVAPMARLMGLGATPKSAAPETMRYLIAIRFLDGKVLDDLSREQGLNGARFARSADPEDNEVAIQIDAGATGEPIGFIVWSPDLPGSRVIARLMPALLGAAFVIAILFLFLLLRLRASLNEQKTSEASARYLASHDALTGLPNRAFFSDRLEACLSAAPTPGQRQAIALIDLDRFKAVNDSFGHAAGDELIRTAADRMQSIISSADTLARFGGDEFALLLRHAGDEDGLLGAVSNALIAELKRPFSLGAGGVVTHVGGSIGMVVLPASQGNASELLRQADLALYEAKHQGRGCAVQFQPAMEEGRKAGEALKSQLRALLSAPVEAKPLNLRGEVEVEVDRRVFGHLELYYQTIHRASGNYQATGAEALVRWNHPQHGVLAPGHFIPLAEEGGLIELLGHWVLREACRAAADWPSATFVAVNVSPSQLRAKNFDADVERVLLETGLAPSRLELEVTESALIEDSGHVAFVLENLRLRGIQISLDDFGTGYSSLSHLMQFGIDRIKIDRSFVSWLDSRANGAAIVSALVTLAHTLGISTTAEGIETEAQRDFLVALGCTDLQGYLFSHPMPLQDLRLLGDFSPIISGQFSSVHSPGALS